MTDKIADIRERHAQSDANYIEFESAWDIHADRATLLAEVEKLLRDLATARAERDEALKELADWQQSNPLI